ncbi:hypothetical protein MMSP_0345 [Mycobacterium sp. 012931]|nr:hypothetical protein MMSP_0345 [Mycobacterium sp. 012931]
MFSIHFLFIFDSWESAGPRDRTLVPERLSANVILTTFTLKNSNPTQV